MENRLPLRTRWRPSSKGISIIYQEFNLLPDRTVAHNIFLGREPSRLGVIDVHRMNEQATAVMKEIGLEKMISPTALVSSLSVAEQQLVEIAKAISLQRQGPDHGRAHRRPDLHRGGAAG